MLSKTLFLALGLSFAMTACSESERLPEGHPADETRYSHTGLWVKPKVAVGTNNTVAWVQYLIANWERKNNEGVPAIFSPIKAQRGCAFAKPADGSKLAYVSLGESRQAAPIYAMTQESIDSAASQMLKQIQRNGKVTDKGRVVGGTADYMTVIDLAVTDTSKPLHLVLSGGRLPLWSIHTAPGVKISGISLLGGNIMSVTGIDPGVPIRAMTDAKMEKCGVTVARKPTKKWKLLQGNDRNTRETAARMNGNYNRYVRWFGKSFGAIHAANTVDAMQARHALIGPAPRVLSERIPHHSLEGATVYTSEAVEIIAGKKSAYRKKKWSVAKARAEQLSGGPLASLN